MTASSRRTTAAVAVGLSLSAALTACSSNGRNETQASTTASAPPTAASSAPSTGAAGTSFADGTYRATGWYGGGPSSIGVTLRLSRGVVTAVEVTPNATNPTSLDYQRRFAAAVPEVVVGRPLSEVRVSRLAGASTTPDGFNDALNKIRAQAAA